MERGQGRLSRCALARMGATLITRWPSTEPDREWGAVALRTAGATALQLDREPRLALPRPLPRTRLLPNRVTDGFSQDGRLSPVTPRLWRRCEKLSSWAT